MATPNKNAIFRAQQAIDAFKATSGLEGDDETLLWHMIYDLLEWCDAKAVDFDATVSYVRAEYQAQD